MPQLSNEELTLAVIPGPGSRWSDIEQFALTYPQAEKLGPKLAELGARHAEARTVPTDLSELRACLWFEQRRWRHFQAVPDGAALEHVFRLLAGIKAAVAKLPPLPRA